VKLVFCIGTRQRWMYFIKMELEGVVYQGNGQSVVRTEDTEYRHIHEERRAQGLLPDEVRYLGGGDHTLYDLYYDLKRLTKVMKP
jgi:hypothetical protein